MMVCDPRLNPVLISHVYWERIPEFKLSEDTYPTWVLFAVTEGSFHFHIRQEEGIARLGDVVLCPPFTAFKRKVIEPLSFHFFRLNWEIPEGQPPAELPGEGKWKVSDVKRLVSDYDYLAAVTAEVKQNDRLIDHLLRDIWHLCNIHPPSPSRADPQIKKAAHLLQLHAFDRMLLQEIAAQVRLSPVQFTRKFKAVYGQTPVEFVTALRLQRAKTLLLETGLTIEEIAQRCGYDNGFYLSRIFSRHLGMSPSRFRRENRV